MGRWKEHKFALEALTGFLLRDLLIDVALLASLTNMPNSSFSIPYSWYLL